MHVCHTTDGSGATMPVAIQMSKIALTHGVWLEWQWHGTLGLLCKNIDTCAAGLLGSLGHMLHVARMTCFHDPEIPAPLMPIFFALRP